MTGGEAREAAVPRLGIVDGLDGQWLIEEVDHCTCGAGPPAGVPHEPGCGEEPVMTVTELHERLRSAAATSREALEALAADWDRKADALADAGNRDRTQGRAVGLAKAAAELRALLAEQRDDERCESYSTKGGE